MGLNVWCEKYSFNFENLKIEIIQGNIKNTISTNSVVANLNIERIIEYDKLRITYSNINSKIHCLIIVF